MSILDQRTLKNDQDQDAQNNQQMSGQASTMGRSSSFNTGLPASQKGSGRFMNLQKYIGANEGAGEQIAGRMGNAASREADVFGKNLDVENQKVQSGIGAGQQLLGTQGEEAKSKLGSFQSGLNTFGGFNQPGAFNQTGSDIQAFTQSPQFGQFQSLQSGAGIDESALQGSQALANQMAQARMKTLQGQNQGIQTEQGRYDLMRQAQPRLGGYSAGQGRLDQLMFQSNPNAISQLQNVYAGQLGDVNNASQALATQGQNLSNLVTQESDLSKNLNEGAQGLQNTFYNKLMEPNTFNQVNTARQGLYDEYANQMRSGQYSQDLANMLGVSGLNTYNPFIQTGLPGGHFEDPIGKITPIGGGSEPSAATNPYFTGPNQFRTYNTISSIEKDPISGLADMSGYLSKGRDASTFQDLLTQPNYNTYNALKQFAPNSGFETKAIGQSQLAPAVAKSGVGDLSRDIQLADIGFKQTANQDYTNQYSPTTIGGPASSATANLNDYMYSGNEVLRQNPAIRTTGADEFKDLAEANLRTQLAGIRNQAGFGNVATIDPNLVTSEQDAYKRFKGLV